MTLQSQCKSDNIKISLNLTLAIEEVVSLFKALPNLRVKAKENLRKSRGDMEKFMTQSSNALANKILHF
jgi:hypothetical protein